jgi:glycosyltransferase involved in cell wall biosynthesis
VRVLIDTTYAQRAPHSGTAVYLSELIAALGRLSDVDVVTAANRSRRAPGGGGAASVANAVADLRWTELRLPRCARRAGAEVIHHPLPAYAHTPRGLAQVITVHDLAFERHPELFDPAYRRWAHLTHRDAGRRAALVICPSETTAADVRELWGIAPAKIVVVRHGPGQDIAGPVERAATPGHFLYIGDAEPRKDLPTLLAAHRSYVAATAEPLPLVLAGSAHAEQPRVIVEHLPTAARLRRLLADAVALVHPAVHEGVGLTLLEAMSAGTPVIAAAAPGSIETCGDAARYVTPRDPEQLSVALAELAADPALQRRLGERGRARSATLSWNLAARGHRDAYSVALRHEDRDPGHEGHPGLLQRL